VDLPTLLSRHEGKTLEFKRDLSSTEGVLKAIVAFANTSGGVVVIDRGFFSLRPAFLRKRTAVRAAS
jgi:hypothetical protein